MIKTQLKAVYNEIENAKIVIKFHTHKVEMMARQKLLLTSFLWQQSYLDY